MEKLYKLEFSVGGIVTETFFSTMPVLISHYKQLLKYSSPLDYVALVTYDLVDGMFLFSSRKLLKIVTDEQVVQN